MKIKIEWPDGSGHTYDTDHAGVNRLADFLTQMYVMNELELVGTLPAAEYNDQGDELFKEGTVEYALEYVLQCLGENGAVGPRVIEAAELALYGPAIRSEGPGELQYATGRIITPNNSEDIMDQGERIEIEQAIKEGYV